ncbi:spore germination protein [Cohnella suwonensis]|uniref:Spore germination protein n=1 Tax=Cohnella suwonensis TaxID=696072 RepID=A0ABW0LUR4_9BACL
MLSGRLEQNIRRIQEDMGNSGDLQIRTLSISWTRPSPTGVAIIYLDGMADVSAIQESVIPSLLDRIPHPTSANSPDLLEVMRSFVLDAGSVLRIPEWEVCLDAVIAGNALLLIDGEREALVLEMCGYEDRGIQETKTQIVVRGPRDAFTETLIKNVSLIRRRIKDPRMRVVMQSKGKVSNTNICVMYLEGIAERRIVDEVFAQLEKVDLRGLFDGQYLEEFFTADKWTLFPTVYNTDRPDSASAMLLEGRIVIMVDGSPFVLVVPAVLVDFIQSAEDYYQPVYFSNLIRTLRVLALVIALLAPSLYIAVTTFHPDLLPTQLLLSLSAQREGIPFPAFIEALMMEITFEILREAGIRMPVTAGQSVAIVGTIVVGQAAVEAGIVSAAMIIVVSITAIASFVIPSYALGLAIRVHRFFFMALAATMGIYGLTIGIIVSVLMLCRLDSFGVAYLSPFAPFVASKQKDAFLRFPFWMLSRSSSERRRRT